jgi:hypothetical protein
MADGACGIDFKLRGPPGVRDLFSEDDFGGGRAADVAKADKKQPEGGTGGVHV